MLSFPAWILRLDRANIRSWALQFNSLAALFTAAKRKTNGINLISEKSP
jgi:hypothetical protein